MANITAAMANVTTAVADVITTTVADFTAAMTDVTTTVVADITTTVTADIAATVIDSDTTTTAFIADITTTTITTTGTTVSSSTVVDPLMVAKTVAMLVLGLGSLVLGVAPLALVRRWHSGSFYPRASGSPTHHQHPGEAASGSRVVSLLLCFGGGVLLCTTLLHLQPEVREAVAAQQRNGHLGDAELLADLLFCAGFFMVLAADELAHTVLERWCCGFGNRRRSASAQRNVSPGSAADQPSATVSLNSFRETAEPERPDSPRQESLEDESTESQQQQQQQQQQQPRDDDDDVEKQQTATSGSVSLSGLFAVLALSFHEVFEGLALGLESRVDHVWYLFAAVATHKFVIAFYVGLDLAWSNTHRAVLVAYVGTFAAVTPVGIACGMAITRFGVAGTDGSPGPVAVVLQGLAAGTLLYVVFFEMLARHRQSGWSHLAAIVIGFGTLYALQMLTHHHHHHHEHGQVKDFGHDEEHFPYHDHHSHHGHGHSH